MKDQDMRAICCGKENSQLPDHYGCVGRGWQDVIYGLHTDMLQLDPGYAVLQVKEKFGWLRTYLTASRGGEAVHEAVAKWEKASSEICEWCGKPGTLDYRFGWMLTLCPACQEERAAVRKIGPA